MNGKMIGLALALAAALVLGAPAPAEAQVDFGVRGGFYSDASAGFIGGELLFGLTREWFLNPNFEYVFVDDGDLSTLNLDFHYDLPTGRDPYYVWLGGGPALVLRSDDRDRDDGDDNDLGFNLLAGVGFGKREAIRPYVQGKVLISNNTEAAIAVGLRFY
jgi:hypothetical protein